MEQQLQVISFVLSLGASLVLMPLLIRYAPLLRLMDDPDASARKLHGDLMPRSGGLGIIGASGITLLFLVPIDETLLSFLLASLLIVFFGLIDDLLELTPLRKLMGQALGVAVAMYGGMVISDLPFLGESPVWLSYPLTFLFVMAVINGVNFSDGMDGLAAGTALMSLVLVFAFALESGNSLVALVSIAISAALVGFLRFNTHPARIFMGDAGSQFLGFSLCWLCIAVTQSDGAAITTLMPLLVLALPILDIVQVVPVRIHKRLPLAGPDKEHLHHQVAKLGLHQYEVVATLYVLQSTLLLGAYAMRYEADAVVTQFFLIYAVFVLGGLYVLHSYGWRLRESDRLMEERRNPLFRRLGELHPFSGKFYGVLVSLTLMLAALASGSLQAPLVYLGMSWAGVLGLAMWCTRRRGTLLLARLATYSAAVFTIYGIGVSVGNETVNFYLNAGFIVLGLCLAVSVRTTRKTHFTLNPQDLLFLLFIVLLAPRLPLELNPALNEGEMVFRTMIMLYACEYVLLRGAQARQRLTVSALLALFLLGLNLL